MFDMVVIIFAVGGDERKYYVLSSLFCLPLYDLKFSDTHAQGKKKVQGIKTFSGMQIKTTLTVHAVLETNKKNLPQRTNITM